MEKRVFIIDRIEDGIATLIAEDNGEAVNVPADYDGFPRVNDAVILEDGKVTYIEYPDKTAENAERLKRLFGE